MLLAMHDSDIFVKTDAGRDEIQSRKHGLSMPMRAILLMVDGQKTVASMRSIIAGSKAPADALDTLLQNGLIEPRDAGGAPVAAPPMMSISCGIASITGPSAPPVMANPPKIMTSRTTRPIAGNMVVVTPLVGPCRS